MEMVLDQHLSSLERSVETRMTSPESTRPRRVATAIGVVVALLVICFLAIGPLTLAFPRSCSVCHVPATAYQSWRTSSHRDVACQQCHTDRAVLAGVGNSFALASTTKSLVLHKSNGPVRVTDQACVRCHPDLGQEKPVVSNGLRMSHAGLSEAGYGCVECHADVVHPLPAGRPASVSMSVCLECHDNVSHSGKCGVCHVGTGSKAVTQSSDPHGPTWRQTHGMGDLKTCTVCHPRTYCKTCHAIELPHDDNFFATHGQQALGALDVCQQCHTQTFCDSCHGMQMPHPSGFLKIHSSAASSVNDPRCTKCHVPDNCQECHIKHIHTGGVGK
jgi:hypothetical protein